MVDIRSIERLVTVSTTSRAEIHAEMERARREFHALLEQSTPRRAVPAVERDGAGPTVRLAVLHAVRRLITREPAHRGLVVCRAPLGVQAGFARLLDAATGPFDQINYLGPCTGAWALTGARMRSWCDRVIDSLLRHLDADTDAALSRAWRSRCAGIGTSHRG